MFKRASVVMLPTNEKASPFVLTENNYLVITGLQVNRVKYVNQNLYIISDDKIENDNIKENDYVYNSILGLGRIKIIHNEECFVSIKISDDDGSVTTPWKRNIPNDCKKIIVTTDTTIKIKSEQAGDNTWYNPYPRPSDSFISKYIEEYNKGNIITDVMVEYEVVYDKNPEFYGSGMFNSNEVKLKINPKDNTITIKKIKDSWNREEIHILFKELVKGRECKAAFMCYTPTITDVDKWLNDNL